MSEQKPNKRTSWEDRTKAEQEEAYARERARLAADMAAMDEQKPNRRVLDPKRAAKHAEIWAETASGEEDGSAAHLFAVGEVARFAARVLRHPDATDADRRITAKALDDLSEPNTD